MADDVKPYTREELDEISETRVASGHLTRGDARRLLATARAGLDAQERLSKDHNPFSLEALDAENERLRADSQRLNWLSQHITNIDWMQYQNGDDIRQIIDTRSGLRSSSGEQP